MKNIHTNTQVAVFRKKEVRKIFHKDEWWFVIEDVVRILANSTNPKGYIKDMRRRDKNLSKGWGQIATPLSIMTPGGSQKLNCANTEGIFRIIQSIPSSKAEPFKQWLAKVGHERLQEIENPEIAAQRARNIYKAKGYPDSWIDKRMRGIEVRATLTNEWKKRGVNEGREYALLTAEISRATFGMTPNEYQKYKGLAKENLRDHMTDLELIFTMLGEASTTEIAKQKDTQGFEENHDAAREGGSVAGNARRQLERKSGKKVATRKNFLLTTKEKELPA